MEIKLPTLFILFLLACVGVLFILREIRSLIVVKPKQIRIRWESLQTGNSGAWVWKEYTKENLRGLEVIVKDLSNGTMKYWVEKKF